MKDLLAEFINLFFERKVREAQLSGGRTTEWGSDEHISDLENRWHEMCSWRDWQPKGSETRANYARVAHKLKSEMKSAKKHAERKKLQEKQKNERGGRMNLKELYLLAEGGAVGHLMHLYDNPELAFGEIKSILQSAATGKLQKATEKFDGLNIVFTWNNSIGQLLVARSAGDIKRGGMNAEELASKFSGRGNLKDAFDSAFSILSGAIRSLPQQKIVSVFGEEGNKWYSAEVIYTENPNVINYDSNTIVFHGWPVFEIEAGKVQASDDRSGVDILSSYVSKMQSAVANRGWQVKGPAIVRLSKLSNNSILEKTLNSIDSMVESVGLDDSATIQQYLSRKLSDDLLEFGFNKKIQNMIIDRILGTPDSPTLNDIKKNIEKSQYETAAAFVKASQKLLQGYIRPLELAINDFAVELLRGLESTLIEDSGAEVERLKQATSSAISAIEASGSSNTMEVLRSQMQKLKSLENITSPVEGVVFVYKGNAYKFTGSFAAANKILGIFRYGR
jgi:hypothetical protein